MAHFAKIRKSDNVVVSIHVVNNKAILDENNLESESKGIELLNYVNGNDSAYYWKQTSYNTRDNVHYFSNNEPSNQPPFRYNYASVGSLYLSDKDAFTTIKPYESYILDSNIAWIAPISIPNTNNVSNNEYFSWDEDLHQSNNSLGWRLTKVVSGNIMYLE